MPHLVYADWEWIDKIERKLNASPLDVSESADGRFLFILTPGEVLIYSIPENKVKHRISVDQAYDKLLLSQKNNTLILISRTDKSLKIIQLERIHKLDLSRRPSIGNADAPLTLAVFGDYQWPFCAQLEPRLQQLLEKYPEKIRLVFKNYPLASHQYARKAAAAALAAHAQGKFLEFHNKLFENQKSLNDTKIQEIARELELDMEQFNSDLLSPATRVLIAKDLWEARTLNVRGVPTLFINGKIVKTRNLRNLQKVIEDELMKVGLSE